MRSSTNTSRKVSDQLIQLVASAGVSRIEEEGVDGEQSQMNIKSISQKVDHYDDEEYANDSVMEDLNKEGMQLIEERREDKIDNYNMESFEESFS